VGNPRGLVGLPAQRLFIAWLEHDGWNVAKAGVRSKFQAQDLFGCLDALAVRFDALGHGPGGWDSGWSVWGAQVTSIPPSGAWNSITDRRRKIEDAPLPPAWRRSVVTHERESKTKHRWRVQDYEGDGRWAKAVRVEFDPTPIIQEARDRADAKHREEMDAIRARIAAKEAVRG
jgi:hypothetical protein